MLVLYDAQATTLRTKFLQDHLGAISRHSRHQVHYAAATLASRADFPLEHYDALIVHFSVRVPFRGVFSNDFGDKVTAFKGVKILMIQDEYDLPARSCAAIRRLGIDVVFSTVPSEYRDSFYPADAVPGVEFRQCLTAYVPEELPDLATLPAIAERPLWICYRGRKLPIWYGELGHEKFLIGLRMKEICEARSIPCDIEWDEEKRIYGGDWLRFLAAARVTLGTESGANVVDHTGAIREQVKVALRREPNLDEQELYERYIRQYDGIVRMNQISGRIFEAISCKTGLLLFDGSYSTVVKPHENFIPLNHDFSNIDDVLSRVGDARYIQEMVDRTYADVVQSQKYGYGDFISEVDSVIDMRAPPGAGRRQRIYAVVSCNDGGNDWTSEIRNLPFTHPIPLPPPSPAPVHVYRPLLNGSARRLWLAMPSLFRRPTIWLIRPIVDRLRASVTRQ